MTDTIIHLEGVLANVFKQNVGYGALYCEGSESLDKDNTRLIMTGGNVFQDNTMSNSMLELSGGALSIYYGQLLISGSAIFARNVAHRGGAISILRSEISCNGSVVLSDNTADYGGGMHIAWSSMETSGCDLHFLNNTAKEVGGGISIGYPLPAAGNYFDANTREVLISASFANNTARCGVYQE